MFLFLLLTAFAGLISTKQSDGKKDLHTANNMNK